MVTWKKKCTWEIPPSFKIKNNVDKVYKLWKSMYGLKQSLRVWFDDFTKTVKEHGYCQRQVDHTLFTKFSLNGKIAILIVYVDNIIVTEGYTKKMDYLNEVFVREFEIKDQGTLRYFLGIEVARSKKGIVVSQRKYILDSLKETEMLWCKPIDTLMESKYKMGLKRDSHPIDIEKYQWLIGKLIYLSHTRHDICFPIKVMSQFMNKSNEKHLEAVYMNPRYLKMTPRKGIFFWKWIKKLKYTQILIG